MFYFYEIRSTTDTVLVRNSGFASLEAAKVAAREDAKRMRLLKHLGVANVGKILVGQNANKPTI